MDIIPKYVNDSWINFIENENNIKVLQDVRNRIGNDFYPKNDEVLRFLETDLNNAKCVLMGMDPYKQGYKDLDQVLPVATGRSFEVRSLSSWNDKVNRSLMNILKKIYCIYNNCNDVSITKVRCDINNGEFDILQPSELFNNLEDQGVIFLNSSLTLIPNVSGSHMKYWKDFMDLVIIYMTDVNPDMKWLLFGVDAQNRVKDFVKEENCIYAKHPVSNSFVKGESFERVREIKWNGLK